MNPITPQPEQIQYQVPMDSAGPPQLPPHRHFLNKKFIITFVILLLLGAGAYAGVWYWYVSGIDCGAIDGSSCPVGYECKYRGNYPGTGGVCVKAKSIPSDVVVIGTRYESQYGFSIALPDSWEGYTVLNSQWEGITLDGKNTIVHGPKITLRHPQWTTANPHEDMPVVVFTVDQWALIQSEKMSGGAAPIPPSVLGQNSKYIIALPARYNYDYKTGWEEVDQLVHTLKAFEPTQ